MGLNSHDWIVLCLLLAAFWFYIYITSVHVIIYKNVVFGTICSGLRNHLKKFATSLGIKRCLVLDSCCMANCPATANTPTRLEALKKVCTPDGVHFTAVGYKNMVAAILGGDSQLTASNMSVKSGKQSHYWRGFKSTRGSVSAGMRGGKSARGGRFMWQFHPYRRGK
jgi:hypothetical protein